jgi:hypothetical protein
MSVTPTLSWEASTGARSYAVCIDTSAETCNVVNYTNVGNATSYTLPTPLTPNTVYYWQVRATFPGPVYAFADSNTPWSFTTQSAGFTKNAPSNGATVTSLTPTLS